jgi:hypothetical protein
MTKLLAFFDFYDEIVLKSALPYKCSNKKAIFYGIVEKDGG